MTKTYTSDDMFRAFHEGVGHGLSGGTEIDAAFESFMSAYMSASDHPQDIGRAAVTVQAQPSESAEMSAYYRSALVAINDLPSELAGEAWAIARAALAKAPKDLT